MTDLPTMLREAVALVQRATDGRWYVEPLRDNEFGQMVYSVNMEDGRIPTVESGEFYGDPRDAEAACAAVNFLREHGPALLRDAGDGARLDYIERTFRGMSNGERYLPLVMGWGKSRNGRTLREAIDKYMAKEGK